MMTLRQARRLADVTVDEMAATLGISKNTYIAYERNPGRMRVETAQAAAEKLGRKPEEIFFHQGCN